jgi:hypothetical protein
MRRFTSWPWRLLACGLLMLAVSADVRGQSFQGGLRGAVKDANGVIPGVEVTLINEGTNVSRNTISNEAGEYNFAAVLPGTYTVRAVLQGFKTYERKGIAIGTQQFITLDLTLEVGAIQEEISVTAAAPLIETSNASTGEVLDKRALETLPAPGRNAFMIAVSVPTVIASGDPQFNRQQDQTNATLVSLGGGARRANNYLLDGVPITDMRNRASLIPSMEAVEEVKVQVHTYDAEMGRTGGGVFNTTLKSGSNALHGSAFYQTRPVWGQANNYFNELRDIPKPTSLYYRLYGGSVGGPIVKDRTFFWAATEGYRSLTTRNGQLHFPTARERNGDFSQTFNRDGSLNVIYDPLTTRPNPNGPGFIRDPFPGNVIPADRLSTVGKNLASFFPLPDENASVLGVANYFRTAEIVDQGDMVSGKVEHKFSDRLSLTGAYIYNRTNEPATDYFKDVNPFADPGRGLLVRRPKVLTLNAILIPNTSSVWSFRYGWNTFPDNCEPYSDYDLASLGFPSSFVNAVQFEKFPRVIIEDYRELSATNSLGDRGPLDLKYYSQGANFSFSKFIGTHTIKMGADYRRIGFDQFNLGQSSGTFRFDREYTGDIASGSLRGGTGNALANMLLGYTAPLFPDENFAPVATEMRPRLDYYAGYVQDDWRLNSRFTLNFGLRYEYETGLREANNAFTVAFDPDAPSPVTLSSPLPSNAPQAGRSQLTGGLRYAGQDGFPEYQGDPSKAKFAPRVGVAWTLDDKTVVRGGYGIFWAPWNYQAPGQTNYGQIGFTQTTLVDSGTREIPRLTASGTGALDDPFPGGLIQPFGNTRGVATGLGLAQIEYVSQNRQSPRVQQFSVDLQRELGGNMAFGVGYSGARGDDLGYGGSNDAAININEINPQFLSLGSALTQQVANPFFGQFRTGPLANATVPLRQLLRPYPQFGNIIERQTTGASNEYHAVTVKLDKRLSNGWGGRFSYTWSRLKDDQFAETNFYSQNHQNSQPLNPYDLDAEWSYGILDTPHKIIVSPMVELPFGEGKRWANSGWANYLIGGWTITAIGTLEAGFPRNIVMNSNNTGFIGSGPQRPNWTGEDPQLGDPWSPYDNLGALPGQPVYINSAAYQNPAPFTLGTGARTDERVRTPWRKNLDVVFAKDTPVVGNVKGQIRLEMLNLTNTPLFTNGGNGQVGNASFGTITSQGGFARILQVAFRVFW